MQWLPPVQVLYNILPVQYYGIDDWRDASHHPFEVYHSVDLARMRGPAQQEDRFFHTGVVIPRPAGFDGKRIYDEDAFDEDGSLIDEADALHDQLMPLFLQAERDSGARKHSRLHDDGESDYDSFGNIFDRTLSYLFEDHRLFTERLLLDARQLLLAEFPLWRVGLHHYPAEDCNITEWLMVYPDGCLHERYTSHEAHAHNEREGQCLEDDQIAGWLAGWHADMEEAFQQEWGDCILQFEYVRSELLEEAVRRSDGTPRIIACFDRASQNNDCPSAWLLIPKQADASTQSVFSQTLKRTYTTRVGSATYQVDEAGQILGGYVSFPAFHLIRLGYPNGGKDLFIEGYSDVLNARGRVKHRVRDRLIPVAPAQRIIPMQLLR